MVDAKERIVRACVLFEDFAISLFILPMNRIGLIYIKPTYAKVTTFEINLIKFTSFIQIKFIF